MIVMSCLCICVCVSVCVYIYIYAMVGIKMAPSIPSTVSLNNVPADADSHPYNCYPHRAPSYSASPASLPPPHSVSSSVYPPTFTHTHTMIYHLHLHT